MKIKHQSELWTSKGNTTCSGNSLISTIGFFHGRGRDLGSFN